MVMPTTNYNLQVWTKHASVLTGQNVPLDVNQEGDIEVTATNKMYTNKNYKCGSVKYGDDYQYRNRRTYRCKRNNY
jgi:hypothetical protein